MDLYLRSTPESQAENCNIENIPWWAHQDLNLEPTDYESAALTVELWAREVQSIRGQGPGARGQLQAALDGRQPTGIDAHTGQRS